VWHKYSKFGGKTMNTESVFEKLFEFLDRFPDESDKKKVLTRKLTKGQKGVDLETEIDAIMFLYESRQ
jgi:hypothetical protein